MIKARSASPSLKDVLDENGGVGRGFDLLRLALSLVILTAHCSGFVGNHGLLSTQLQALFHHFSPEQGAATIDAANAALPATANSGVIRGPARPFTLSHVPMFFALSGFLVAGSAFRSKKVFPFLALRFFRIFPALLVEVSLSAIVLGSVFTTLPLTEYFSSSGFLGYFGNIVGVVQLGIPSVVFPFSHKDANMLNANLWTLPAELHCYILMAILIGTGVLVRRTTMTILFFAYTAVMVVASIGFGVHVSDGNISPLVITYYFVVGLMFYIWREKIIFNFKLFVFCLVASYILMFSPRLVYVYPALLVYVTIYIGLSALPQSKILKSGDYSYGIYLYSYPISQALLTTVPIFRDNLLLLLPSSILVTCSFAFLSWHLIEKRFLRLRKRFSPESAKIAERQHPSAFLVDPSS